MKKKYTFLKVLLVVTIIAYLTTFNYQMMNHIAGCLIIILSLVNLKIRKKINSFTTDSFKEKSQIRITNKTALSDSIAMYTIILENGETNLLKFKNHLYVGKSYELNNEGNWIYVES